MAEQDDCRCLEAEPNAPDLRFTSRQRNSVRLPTVRPTGESIVPCALRARRDSVLDVTLPGGPARLTRPDQPDGLHVISPAKLQDCYAYTFRVRPTQGLPAE